MDAKTNYKLKVRATSKAAKRDARKNQIADSAVAVLSQYGYANTALRDIAEQSQLSLGMLHYYFEDKQELLVYCVKRYKQAFIAEIKAAAVQGNNPEDRVEGFANGLVVSLIKNAQTHRLWYDMRSQAMFDERFQPMMTEIEDGLREIIRLLVPGDLGAPDRIYPALDGLFRDFLQRTLRGDRMSPGAMENAFADMIRRLI